MLLKFDEIRLTGNKVDGLEAGTHTATKYLENIVEIFLGNIVRLLKYFETYHKYC